MLAPDPKAVKYLLAPQGPPPETVRSDWRPSQQIALSHVDDRTEGNGLLELRLDDERYLPFEGTGAVSTWRLRAAGRLADLADLQDVVAVIRYTADDGGEVFTDAVRGMLKPYGAARFVDVAAEFPDEWAEFQDSDDAELVLPFTTAMFPGMTGRDITGIYPNYDLARGTAQLVLEVERPVVLDAGRMLPTPGLRVGTNGDAGMGVHRRRRQGRVAERRTGAHLQGRDGVAMTGKRRKDVGTEPVGPHDDDQGDKAQARRHRPVRRLGRGTASSKPTASASIATGTLLKTKRMPPTAPYGVQPDAIIRVATSAEIDAHDQVLADARRIARSGLAATFARALQRVAKGVTIGIDERPQRRCGLEGVRAGGESVAEGPRDRQSAGSGRPGRSADARPRRDCVPLHESDGGWGRRGAGTGPLRRCRLGVAAADATKVGAVADAALEGLRARLRGEAPRNEALPADLVTLLNEAAKAWRSTSDADFWASMAKVAQPAKGASPEAFLREQAAWMGLVADLSLPDHNQTWTWNSAAEKADLVDTLVTAAAGSALPVTAVLRRLRTLTRGADPLPRAVAAELAQLALAALAGVKTAVEPDRNSVIMIKERAPEPTAPPAEQAEHDAREALRGAAHALVLVDDASMADPFDTRLYRNKLSTVYADMMAQFRQMEPENPGEPSGEQRYQRLLEVVGPLHGALVEALDRWSAAIASGSTDPADYVAEAREVEAALEGFLQRLDEARDPTDHNTKLFAPFTSPEQIRVGSVVRRLAVEVGLEAGEVLLGQVAPPAEPAAGLRHLLLRRMPEAYRRLELQKKAMAAAGGKLKMTTIVNRLKLPPSKAPWKNALTAAAAAFDAARNTKPLDRTALAAAARDVITVGNPARTAAGQKLQGADRQAVTDALDLLYVAAADMLEQVPPPPEGAVDLLGPQADGLRQAVTPLPLPAPGVGLDKFWSDQKANGLRALPSALRKQVDDAMNLDLGSELARLTKLAAAGNADAIEAQGWTAIRIMRAYKNAIAKLPDEQAEPRARLAAALDGVAAAVERLLPASVAVEV